MSRSSRQRLYGGKSEPYRKVWQGGKARRLHRVLAEEKLGRKLKVGEVVHHRQGFEDLPENLVVLPSQRHHMLVHQPKSGCVPSRLAHWWRKRPACGWVMRETTTHPCLWVEFSAYLV
jgi:hypothetical protein